MLKGKGPSGFGYGSTAEEVTEGLDLSGKTYLVTGCNSGLGLETMRVLSLRGAHVIAAARTAEKAANAIAQVSANATPVACELSDPASVRACVENVKQTGRTLDAMICNAGIMALPKLETSHGYELQFFTNHVGHFILVTSLLDQLAEDGRVVIVSSAAHLQAPKETIEFDNLDGSKRYNSWRNYGQSKMANILFARHLSKKFEGTQRTANALHPGVIQTNLGRHMGGFVKMLLGVVSPLFLKSIPQGAATQCYVATHPSLADVSGEYFADCNIKKTRKDAKNDEIAEKLWAKSEEIIANV
ncbi:MAG: SDR family oxidoreductase [Deltaproteobacteria bacterium]|nr:MAG: SDR family oxidoreductase [Deltaproteobacteria bacterium]